MSQWKYHPMRWRWDESAALRFTPLYLRTSLAITWISIIRWNSISLPSSYCSHPRAVRPRPSWAVINFDDPYGRLIGPAPHTLRYGFEDGADLRAFRSK